MDHADGHRYFEGLAVAHVLGGLDDSEGRVFRAHLLECGSCRARVGELRAIAHDLADVERDERRVRAAQAIDTKRRESDDEVDVTVEAMPSPRSSRITVIVGLVLIIGLSLWNFTLRSAMTVQDAENASIEQMVTIAEIGRPWEVDVAADAVTASVRFEGSRFAVVADGLDPKQVYGLYAAEADGTVVVNETVEPVDGRMFALYGLESGVEPVVVKFMNPTDTNGTIGKPGPTPTGVRIFEATPPID